MNDIVSCCRDLLIKFPNAKPIADYLDNRLPKDIQEKFSFGYFPPNTNLQSLISVVSEEKLSKLGLLYKKIMQDGVSNRNINYSPMENHNLILPYRDVHGKIVALVGRSILSDEQRQLLNIPKYKNTTFKKGKHLFGLFESKPEIIKKNLVVVVEGQFDCIKAHSKGLNNIVALGSSSMTFDQFALITRYTNNIILMLDNDNAGKIGTERIMKLYSNYANITTRSFPKNFKDIDEFLSIYNIEDLEHSNHIHYIKP